MGEHNCYGRNRDECVRIKAYEFWEKDGRKQGNDEQYWLDAERSVTHGHIKDEDPKPGKKRGGER
ncbi:MAG: DUF2934 domain-containing protein [Candidatus Omnitrophica bacterium]|nr:DUF2934 domain-containing protein [Candidatus Omnitrophota bacterium]